MKRFRRSDRVSEELKKELALIIQNELKDPRIGSFVSVTRVEASKDLKNARAYISVFGPDEEKEGTMVALTSAAGFIRSAMGKRMHMRSTPELTFKLDDSMEYSAKIQRILNEVTPASDDTPLDEQETDPGE